MRITRRAHRRLALDCEEGGGTHGVVEGVEWRVATGGEGDPARSDGLSGAAGTTKTQSAATLR